MSKDTRDKVTLSPEAFKTLEIEAMLQGISLKDAASKLIIKAACPKCIEILGVIARPPKEKINPIAQSAQELKGQKALVPDNPKTKRPRLSTNPDAIAKIKELYQQTPRPSIHEISRIIGYPNATVAENIKKMKAKGELPDNPKD